MAAKPIERFVKKQIQEQGGYDRLEERVASGETIASMARTFLRPDGKSISRQLLSGMLHRDEARSQRIRAARREGAHALVDHAIEVVRSAPADRDSIQKAKVVADVDLKVAGLWNREEYGERQPTLAVQVNVNEMHLGALRHREVAQSVASDKLTAGASHACEAALSPVTVTTTQPEATQSDNQ